MTFLIFQKKTGRAGAGQVAAVGLQPALCLLCSRQGVCAALTAGQCWTPSMQRCPTLLGLQVWGDITSSPTCAAFSCTSSQRWDRAALVSLCAFALGSIWEQTDGKHPQVSNLLVAVTGSPSLLSGCLVVCTQSSF